MKLSPLDIKKQEFGKKFNGFSPDEVHSFLDMVADEMEDLLKKNLEMEENIKSLEEKLANYTKIENVLQDTLLTTQKSAEETKLSAEQRAQTFVDEAKIRAERITADAHEELLGIQKEITDLKNQKDAFIINFKSMLETQKSLLEMVEKRNSTGGSTLKIRMKRDLSEDDLNRVVDDFERQQSTSNADDDGNGSKSDNMGNGN